MSEWRPASEAQPYKPVLVTHVGTPAPIAKAILIDDHDGQGWYEHGYRTHRRRRIRWQITHFMPLPAPPEEKE